MRNLFLLFLTVAMLGVSSCGEEPTDIDQKKQELSEYNTQLRELKAKIADLEKEITQMDPEGAKEDGKAILVATMPVPKKSFEHRIEVRGWVESRKNVLISAETMGKIQSIPVLEGQSVRQGQILLTLDADIIRNNIAEVKTSLELASTLFERQAKLWEQKIGTEVQYLEAKNRKESLESRLATLQSQLDQSVVRAPFAGRVDEISAKVGEIASPGMPLVRLLNPDDVYIKADISESFVGKFSSGEDVSIYFPVQEQTLISEITSVGQVINNENRTFSVEIKMPKADFVVRPNQVAVLKLTDYRKENALVVPTRLIQKDDEGMFLYTVEKEGDVLTATKARIETGLSFGAETEVVKGLQGNERIIEKGYRDVAEGVEVTIASANL